MNTHVTSNSPTSPYPYPQQHPADPSYPYPTQPSSARPPLDDEDVKVPYDDLIDQYATPYRANSQHKTFNLSGPTNAAPTYPLTHKQTNLSDASGKDIEGSTVEGTDWGYPPGPPQKEEKEKHSYWASVRTTIFSISGLARLTLCHSLSSFQTLLHADFTS